MLEGGLQKEMKISSNHSILSYIKLGSKMNTVTLSDEAEDCEMVEDIHMHGEEKSATRFNKERAYVLRERHLESLNRFATEVANEAWLETLTSSELWVRQERLRQHFECFEAADTLYRQSNMLVTDIVYTNVENRYMTTMGKIHEKLNAAKTQQQSSNSATGIDTEPKLPTVIKVETRQQPQLGKFNGNPADWPAFRDLFLAEVHDKDYDPVTKLLYLQRACVDKAAITLGPWQPTRDNYRLAWEMLMTVYNDDYHIIHGILGQLYSINKQERESHDSLRIILDSINSGTRQLENIASSAQLWDQIWIHYGKQRLPKMTLDSWEQHRNRDGETALPSLDQFKKFLDAKSKGRREFEGNDQPGREWHGNGDKIRGEPHNRRDNFYKPYSKFNRPRPELYSKPSFNTNRTGEGNKPTPTNYEFRAPVGLGRCMMDDCTQRHSLDKCDNFGKLGTQERWFVVYKNRLCKCCLRPGHRVAQCTQDGCSNCPQSPSRHHFRLCYKARQNNELSESMRKAGRRDNQ